MQNEFTYTCIKNHYRLAYHRQASRISFPYRTTGSPETYGMPNIYAVKSCLNQAIRVIIQINKLA